MAIAGRVQVILSANLTRFSSGMKMASNQLGAFGKRVKLVSASVTRLGRKMTTFITLPVLAGLGLAVKSFASFDQAMTESMAIMGDLSQETKFAMREMAKDISLQTTFMAADLAKAYFYLASAGLNAAQSIKALAPVARFAQAGAFDLSKATDLLTDAQDMLGLKVEDTVQNMKNMVRVSDVLVRANSIANASVLQFSEALTNNAAAAFKAMNKDVEETVAVLAALSSTVKGLSAGEKVSMMIRYMSKSWIDNEAAWRRMRIEVFDSAGEMRNIADVVGDMERSFAGFSPEDIMKTFDKLGIQARQLSIFFALLGRSDDIRRFEEQLRAAGGETMLVFLKQMKSFTNQLKMFWNAVNVASIEVGEILAPSILKATSKLSEMVARFRNLGSESKKFVVKIALIAAAIGPAILILAMLGFVLSGVVTFFSSLVGFTAVVAAGFGLLVSPIGLIVIGLGGMAAVLVGVMVGWETVGGLALEALKVMGKGLAAFVKSAPGFLYNFQENWGILTAWMGNNWNDMLANMGDDMMASFKTVWYYLSQQMEGASSFYSAVLQDFGRKTVELWEPFLTRLKEVFSLLRDLGKEVSEIWTPIFSKLEGWGGSLFKLLGRKKVDALGSIASKLGSGVTAAASSVGKSAKETAAGMVPEWSAVGKWWKEEKSFEPKSPLDFTSRRRKPTPKPEFSLDFGGKEGKLTTALDVMGEAFDKFIAKMKELGNTTQDTGDAFNELAAFGKQVFAQTRSPLENYYSQVGKLNQALKAGVISGNTYYRALAQADAALFSSMGLFDTSPLNQFNSGLEEQLGLWDKLKNIGRGKQVKSLGLAVLGGSRMSEGEEWQRKVEAGRAKGALPTSGVPTFKVPTFGVPGGGSQINTPYMRSPGMGASRGMELPRTDPQIIRLLEGILAATQEGSIAHVV